MVELSQPREAGNVARFGRHQTVATGLQPKNNIGVVYPCYLYFKAPLGIGRIFGLTLDLKTFPKDLLIGAKLIYCRSE